MANRKADLKKSEVTGYVNAMRAADIQDWRIEVERPDGTTVRIVAGKGAETGAPDEWDAIVEGTK